MHHCPWISCLLENTVFCNRVVPIYVCIVYGGFCAKKSESNSCNRDHMAHDSKIFTIWPFKKNFAKLSRAKPSLEVEFGSFLMFHFSNHHVNIFLYPTSIISVFFFFWCLILMINFLLIIGYFFNLITCFFST